MLRGLTCPSVTQEHPLLKISAWEKKKEKRKSGKGALLWGWGGIPLNRATSAPSMQSAEAVYGLDYFAVFSAR